MTLKAVALDAMGVVYPVADDLREILIPYLRGRGCELADDEIVALFRACYRQGMPAQEFWQRTLCDWADGALESDFLALYELRPGVIEFLQSMRAHGVPVFGLSNDVAEWAIARRKTLGIEAYFEAWVISGEARLFKPDPAIYDRLLQLLPCRADECLFVDDTPRNVEAALAAGLQAVRFVPYGDGAGSVGDFEALERLTMNLLETPPRIVD